MVSSSDSHTQLPSYLDFSYAIAVLCLPISCAELHGVLCGYLVSGRQREAESYLRALLSKRELKKTRTAALALFDVFAISQQQLTELGFVFELMLPNDDESLASRAQAFSEWCEGFTQGLTVSGVDVDKLHNEEAQEAIQHITEFAQLDYTALRVSEEDERALLEVTEYTRMAVLSLQADLQARPDRGKQSTTH